jgi:hypothetical protein
MARRFLALTDWKPPTERTLLGPCLQDAKCSNVAKCTDDRGRFQLTVCISYLRILAIARPASRAFRDGGLLIRSGVKSIAPLLRPEPSRQEFGSLAKFPKAGSQEIAVLSENFDPRTLSKMEIALDRACLILPAGSDKHRVRRLVAGKILECAHRGDKTLSGLNAAGYAAAKELCDTQKASRVG